MKQADGCTEEELLFSDNSLLSTTTYRFIDRRQAL